jgi:hypothetical protein
VGTKPELTPEARTLSRKPNLTSRSRRHTHRARALFGLFTYKQSTCGTRALPLVYKLPLVRLHRTPSASKIQTQIYAHELVIRASLYIHINFRSCIFRGQESRLQTRRCAREQSCRGYYHRRIYMTLLSMSINKSYIQHYLLNNALRRSTQVE